MVPPAVRFSVIGLNHNHIYSQSNLLLRAGAKLVSFFAEEPDLAAEFARRYPEARPAADRRQILEDASIHLVVSAAIPCDRAPLGIDVMRHGKDYMSDKPAVTTLAQLAEVRRVQAETGRIFSVCFSERFGLAAGAGGRGPGGEAGPPRRRRGTRRAVSDRLKVGVVGGGIGKLHVEAYRSLPAEFEVVAICDVDEDKARGLAATHAVPRVVSEFGELCRLDELDVVDLCTPPSLHYAQTLQALEAGRHVICEKPLAASLAEVDRLAAAEHQSGQRVMPIFQYRFGHGIQKLKLLVEQGLAGRAYLTTVETAWRRRAAYYAVPWRARWKTELGGALVSQAIHGHDLVYYVLGRARTVYAHLATRVNPIEIEDCVSASLEMADGSLCSLSVTMGSAAEISRHRFCFSNLTAESNTQPYRNSHDPWTFTADSPEVGEQIRDALGRFAPLPEHFVGQFSRFHRALATGTELPVTVADARAAVELITAIYHAARTRRPVELPIAGDHPLYRGWQP